MNDYPYMMSNNKIQPIITKIQQAARPAKFTLDFLRTLGFTSTNDRAFIPLAKKLGFLMEDGTPTPIYDQLKDSTLTAKVLATQIRILYADLFAINTELQRAPENEIKGAISRVTGKDEEGVIRIYNTFKALCFIADFSENISHSPAPEKIEETPSAAIQLSNRKNEFHYNIQIHLPATTDISVYNAIFKSLKDNLFV